MRNKIIQEIHQEMKKDKKIFFLTADMGINLVEKIETDFPERFLNVGIAEQNMVGISAGLAKSGKLPIMHALSTFLTMRAFEFIRTDLGYPNLRSIIVGTFTGFNSTANGPTHQAIEDISILRVLPNLKIVAPCDAIEMRRLIEQTKNLNGPLYVRIARGGEEIITSENEKIVFGKANVKIEPKEVLFLTTGITTQIAIEATKTLNKNSKKFCFLHIKQLLLFFFHFHLVD